MKYPQPGATLKTCRSRADAKPWDTETDAHAATMEHTAGNSDTGCSIRKYRGDGFYVLIEGAGGSYWLTY